jgi:hypothetical protein
VIARICALVFLAQVTWVYAQSLPGLHFNPPSAFSGTTSGNPAVYTSLDGEAVVYIYPFKRFGGNAEAEFRQSLFREHIPREFREAKRASPPQVQRLAIRGADDAFSARFTEDRAGAKRQRMRVLIRASGAVAILDVDASGVGAWERHWPAVAGVLQSMVVKAE